MKSAITKTLEKPTSSTVALRPDGKPWGAGCGDVSTDKWVPDGMYGADFTQACGIHDDCYGTLGKNKATCDVELGKNIVLACDKALKGVPNTEDLLNSCYVVSGIYQLAVEQKGGPAYAAAQKEAESNK